MPSQPLLGVMRIKRIHTSRQLLEAARHNRRERLKPNIDIQRTPLNYVLAGPEVGEFASQKIARNARTMLKAVGLGNGAGLKPLRKNVVYAVEVVFSLPPTIEPTQIRNYFEDSLAWLGAHFCEPSTILSADVHLDEGAPHMHILILPLVNGKMQGAVMCGGPSQFKKRKESFFFEVGRHYGFTFAPQKLHPRDKSQAIRDVLEYYRSAHPQLLNDPTWPHIRELIELDPFKFLVALGLITAKRSKPMRTMAQIFTSKGKGPAREPVYEKKGWAKDKTLCSVVDPEQSLQPA